MKPRTLLSFVLILAVIGVAFAVTRGDDGYQLRLPLESATGLEDGSAVQIGGIDRGRVELELEEGDRVVATVELEEGAGPVGRNAKASIESANFLGRKRVVLEPGAAGGDPAPDGWTMPADRIAVPTDFDQVLGIFDADTRTRAQVLLAELGETVVGRRVDIRKLLKEFPLGLERSAAVLDRLKTDDARMRDLLVRSDRIVGSLTAERRSLVRLVNTVGDASATINTRRAKLGALLAKAPGTLRELQGLLGDLETTTGDLGPAARELRAAAPAATAAIAELDGFRDAAVPTLREAVDAAPQLNQLALRATPIVRRAQPTVAALATTASDLAPVSKTLDASADNIIAIIENWSRAIQFRDGLSHVFRGEAGYSPDLILSAVDRLSGASKRAREERARRKASGSKPAAPTTAPKAETPADKPSAPSPKPLQDVLKELPKKLLDELPKNPTVQEVQKLLDGVLGTDQKPAGPSGPEGLLDFLLRP